MNNIQKPAEQMNQSYATLTHLEAPCAHSVHMNCTKHNQCACATFTYDFFDWLLHMRGVHRLSEYSSIRKLRVRVFFHKTVRVCHVYCNFKIGFTCRITVIFGTLKDGSLLINNLASNIWFSYRNIFQNGVDALPKIVDAFLSKSSNFHLHPIMFKFC